MRPTPSSWAAARFVALGAGLLLSLGLSTGCPQNVEPDSGCSATVPCADDKVCKDGACVAPCENDDACANGRCLVATGQCVACLESADCGENQVCNTLNNTCVDATPSCQNDGECVDKVCNTDKGICVECTDDAHCGDGTCDTRTNTCRNAGECTTNAECGDGVCNPNTQLCVQCYDGSQCESGQCDADTNTCILPCADADVTEPNNLASEAATLQSGNGHIGTICPTDVDLFRIPGSGTVTATLGFNPGEGALTMRLLDADLNVLQSGTAGGAGLTASASNLPAAIYYVEVGGMATLTGVAYNLTVDVQAAATCVDVDQEPNDDNASALTLSTEAQISSGTICAGNLDRYTFDADAGDELSIQVIAGDGAGTPTATLRDAAGTQLATGNPLMHTAAETGTFYLDVSATGGDVGYTVRATSSAANVPCTQRDAEPNNDSASAGIIASAMPLEGTICEGDTDHFRFVAREGDDLEASVTGAGLTLQLYRDSDGMTVAAGASLNETDLAAGTYRIAVLGTNPQAEGDYTLSMTLTGEPVMDLCGDDGTEPNGATDTARPLAPNGAPVAGRLCMDDEDFFEVTVTEAGALILDLSFIHADGDLDVQLLDSAGARIASALSVTDNELLIRDVQPGTYYARVFSYRTVDTPYTISAAVSTCAEDGFEPNNSRLSAAPIADGTIAAARCPANDDYYAIRLLDGDLLTVTLDQENLALSLLDNAGNVVLTDTAAAPGRSLSSTGPLAAGRYVLRVTGSGAAQAMYNMDVTVSTGMTRSCVDDGAEANETIDTAYDLGGAALADGAVTMSGLVLCDADGTSPAGVLPSDLDAFGVDLSGNKTVRVEAAFASGTDVDLTLWEKIPGTDLSRRIATSYLVEGHDWLEGTLKEGGEYVVMARLWDGDDVSYDLNITTSDLPNAACVDDRFDSFTSAATGDPRTFDNNLVTKATLVGADETLDRLQLCPADKDWYYFNAEVGDNIEVNVRLQHSQGDLDAALYHCPTGQTPTEVDSSADGIIGGNVEEMAYTVPAGKAGRYCVEVYGDNASDTNDYELEVRTN